MYIYINMHVYGLCYNLKHMTRTDRALTLYLQERDIQHQEAWDSTFDIIIYMTELNRKAKLGS